MKKFFTLFLCSLVVVLVSCEKDKTEPAKLTFDTPVVSQIGATAATVTCRVLGVESLESLPLAFAYGDLDMTTAEYTVVSNVTRDGTTLSCRLSGLKPNTSYKVVALLNAGTPPQAVSAPASLTTTAVPADQTVLEITSITTIPAESAAGVYTLTYNVINPVAGEEAQAACPSAWVRDFDYSTKGEISFDVDANTGAERTAVITVTYADAEPCTVSVVQRGAGSSEEEAQEIALNAEEDGWPTTYSNTNKKIGKYFYQLVNVAKYSDSNGVQFKKTSGSMANTEDMGVIRRVEVTFMGNTPSKDFTLCLGDQMQPEANEIQATVSGNTHVFDCSGKEFHYFSLNSGDGAGFVSSFKIVCGGKGGDKPTPANEPQFQMPSYADLTKNSVTISCSYTYTGDKTVSEAYFLYTADGGTEQRANLASAQPGTKTAALTGLASKTRHSFRLNVVVDGKTYSSENNAFTTYDEQGKPSGNTRYPGWAELPSENATLINSEYHYAYHLCPDYPASAKVKARNFTTCYSKSKRCPVWVAAPLHDCYTGDVKRTNAYRTDPDVSCTQAGRWSGYTRGHMLGSNERRVTTNVNRDVFYHSNIGPQLQTYFNTGGGQWNTAEDWVDKQWRGLADTLYQIVGSYWENTSKVVEGTTIPTHYYIVLLKAKKSAGKKWVVNCTSDELQSIAIMVRHKTYAKTEVVKPADFKAQGVFKTVAEIETLTGHNFFPNIPNAPKTTFNEKDWNF